jgi:4'-phosphopantetheinyl transferase
MFLSKVRCLPPPQDLSLLPDEFHIWRIGLIRTESELQNLIATLSSDEIIRAKRFYFEQDRRRFIAGRGILRTILSRYLGIEPQAVTFAYESRGKPLLIQDTNSKISFNLSHSQDLAICGVSLDHNLGVDLEFIRAIDNVESLAERFFTSREYDNIKSLPPNQQQKIFFRYWTCKEAFLKATGVGIGELEAIEISLSPENPARIVTDEINKKNEQWNLTEISIDEKYVAATVINNSKANLIYWQY